MTPSQKVSNAFYVLAWIADQTPNDTDDYMQPLRTAESLVRQGRLDHEDLIRAFRGPDFLWRGKIKMSACGIPSSKVYAGQMSRLIEDQDPLYLASAGITDGGAMRILPVAAMYYKSADMAYFVRAATRITHNTPEAILAAILVAMRIQQALNETQSPDQLVDDFKNTASRLYGNRSDFFIERVESARIISGRDCPPEETLLELAKTIGLMHLAWACPVSAVFWSYLAKPYPDLFYSQYDFHSRAMTVKNQCFEGNLLNPDMEALYHAHLDSIGDHGVARYFRSDIDTFYSIAFSICAMEQGLYCLEEHSRLIARECGHDLSALAEGLVK